jgi:hypothetical protein
MSVLKNAIILAFAIVIAVFLLRIVGRLLMFVLIIAGVYFFYNKFVKKDNYSTYR